MKLSLLREHVGNLLAWLCHLERLSGAPEGVRILTYHRVNDSNPDDRLSVSSAEFREQMRYLAKEGYSTPTLAEFVAGQVPEKPVIITFDDGYADNFLYAMPIMREFRFRATVFLTIDLIGTDGLMPRYAGGGDHDRMLTWSEVERLRAEGWEIGSHTFSHPDLRMLGPDELRREVGESKILPTGLELSSFCYPFGWFNDKAVRAVREAGFSAAVTTIPGANFSGEPLLTLRRTEISGFDNLKVFRLKLDGAFDLLHIFRQIGI